MAYKILYIEDLEAETRNLTFKREYFDIESITPSDSIDKIISDINQIDPDLIILDYILTEGSNLKFCNAPTVAATLRSLTAIEGFKERPIVLMSNQDHIVNLYRKDYTSHDLFDYAITKQNATKVCTEKFINKCISLIEAYKKITEVNFDLSKILQIDKKYIHSKLYFYLNDNNKSIYEYSRFIFEHLIRCSGMIIGEDILSARLGVSKESSDWNQLKIYFDDYKFKGIFSSSYNRWWMPLIDTWWTNTLEEKYSLRHYNAEERVEILKSKTGLNLVIATSSDKNLSTNYWSICKQTKLPLDPFDGIELLEEEFMPWQDKDYISIDGYLEDIEKYSKIVSDLDRTEMRKYS